MRQGIIHPTAAGTLANNRPQASWHVILCLLLHVCCLLSVYFCVRSSCALLSHLTLATGWWPQTAKAIIGRHNTAPAHNLHTYIYSIVHKQKCKNIACNIINALSMPCNMLHIWVHLLGTYVDASTRNSRRALKNYNKKNTKKQKINSNAPQSQPQRMSVCHTTHMLCVHRI